MQEPTWYYTDLSGEQRGPVTANAVRDGLARGEIPATARFWREGLGTWVTLDAVAAELGVLATAPPPMPAATDPYAAPRGVDPVRVRADEVVPAGFIRRWAALFLDQLILSIPLVVVFGGIGFATAMSSRGGGGEPGPVVMLVAYGLYFVIAAFYYAGQESSVHQATLGKRALGIKVTDDSGHRLSFPQALGRWFAAALSYLTFYFGFLMAAFTDRKRALHDIVAGTLVVDKWAYTDHPERQKQGLNGCLIAAVIALALVPIIAILAAISISQYQDYVAKSQVSEAMALADGMKTAVVESYANSSKMPASNTEAGLPAPEALAGKYVQTMEVVADGTIQGTFNYETAAPIRGAMVSFTPADTGGTITWTCHSESIAQKYCPMSCRCQ